MTAQGRQRIIDAGFHVYRRDPRSKVITRCTPQGGWTRVASCYSKRLLDKAWFTLMKDPTSIAD